MTRINLIVTDEKRAQFKSKAAAEGLTMTQVLEAAIDAYLAGRFKPSKKGKKA